VCTPLGNTGASCDAGHGCGYGTVCVGATMTAAGTCQPSITMAGAHCGDAMTAGCNGGLNLVCNTTTHMCETYHVAAAGGPCGRQMNGSDVLCPPTQACATMGGMSQCVPRIPIGGACDSTMGLFCGIGASCVADSSGGMTCRYRANAMCVQQNTAVDCTQITDCYTCAGQAECGWCAGTSTCLAASSDGSQSADGTCTGNRWDYTGVTCN
jgi:hypothetical protein